MTKISSLRAPAVRNLCHRDYVEGGAAIPYGHDVCLPAFLGFGFFSFLHSHHSANQNLQADRHVTALLAVTPDLSLRTVLPLSHRATSSGFQAKRCGSLLVRPFFVPLIHLSTFLRLQADRHVAALLAVTQNLSLRTVLLLSHRATSSAFQAKRCGSLLVRPFFVLFVHPFTIL